MKNKKQFLYDYIKYTVVRLLCLAILAGMVTGCGRKDAQQEADAVRVGSLKGPTSIGLLHLIEKDEAEGSYEFTMAVQADELSSLMIKKELDIALLPANAASILYHRMEGELAVIDINTLGVLYLVTGDKDIVSVEDLKGRTVYLTGKGTTPDYALRYILEGNGLTTEDCRLEYRSEATEVAAILEKEPESLGLLPQPFVTAACAQNQELSVVLDLNEEWEKLQGADASRMVTGVTVVRKEFLEKHQEAVAVFLEEHKESARFANSDPEETAALAVKAGIMAKESVALQAIPRCNITYIDGEEMKQALSGYLGALWEQEPKSIGGSLPSEDFYYLP